MATTLRTLRSGEEERLLDLLDEWELSDGWRGRDFFRRYLEDDPTYSPENVWVASREGTLQACVQIFPRRFSRGEDPLPAGGIGSVFCRPEARGAGLASALLARATDAMRQRHCEVALLFTGRVGFYSARGWSEWPLQARWVEPSDSPGALASFDMGSFDAARDFGAVRAIHAAYSERGFGPARRDPAAWGASLRLAGNPDEVFRVARKDDEVRAYARATVLEGVWVITEIGYVPGAVDAMAALLADLVAPGTSAGIVGSVRRTGVVVPPIPDSALDGALVGQGLRARPAPWGGVMLRCIDAGALALRLGEASPTTVEAETALLHRALPPDRFLFWPADRF